MVSGSAPHPERGRPGQRAAPHQLPRHHSAQRGQVDDSPYGGGAGTALRVDVVDAALEAAYGPDRSGTRIDRPQARRLPASTSLLAAEWRQRIYLALLCGDTRASTSAWSSTGQATRSRRVATSSPVGSGRRWWSPTRSCASCPAPSATKTSAVEESYSEALEGAPEYPHYTRPAEYRGWGVPEILLSGDHSASASGARERSRERGR